MAKRISKEESEFIEILKQMAEAADEIKDDVPEMSWKDRALMELEMEIYNLQQQIEAIQAAYRFFSKH